MSDQVSERESEYAFDLWCQLETVIDLYEQSRTGYWDARMESEERSPLTQLRAESDAIADLIRKRVLAIQNLGQTCDLNAIYRSCHEEIDQRMKLLKDAEATWISELPPSEASKIRRLLRTGLKPDPQFMGADEPLRLVWERLCIEDAWQTVASIRDRVRRMLDLERLIYDEVGKRTPSPRTARFLLMVSRNYVWGFDPECVAMCRSAMEAAFRDCVTSEHFQRAGMPESNGLHEMITVAVHVRNNLLSGRSDLFQAAETVRLRGNKVIHGDPDAVKDVLGTIRLALRVIGALPEDSVRH